MSEFKPGDIVDIVIKGVRIDFPGNEGLLPTWVDEHDRSYPIPAQAEITVRPLPDNWPPKPGDLWHMENDGADPLDGLFFARLAYGPFDEHPEDRVPWVELVCATGDWKHAEPEELLPLGRWTLVRREGQDGGEDR